MDFSESNPPVPQPDPGASFYLPPVTFAIQAAKSCEIADSATSCDRFDVAKVADELEVRATDSTAFSVVKGAAMVSRPLNLGNRMKPVCCVAARPQRIVESPFDVFRPRT
jgi:hypothetical protein